MTAAEHITRSFDFGTTPNEKINAEIDRIKSSGYELVGFEDMGARLRFFFKRADGQAEQPSTGDTNSR